jgi:hypothetical protein
MASIIIITGEFSSNAVHCLAEKYIEFDVMEAGSVSTLGRRVQSKKFSQSTRFYLIYE